MIKLLKRVFVCWLSTHDLGRQRIENGHRILTCRRCGQILRVPI